MLEKIFLITSGGNEPRAASSVRRVQKTCGASQSQGMLISFTVVDGNENATKRSLH